MKTELVGSRVSECEFCQKPFVAGDKVIQVLSGETELDRDAIINGDPEPEIVIGKADIIEIHQSCVSVHLERSH